MSTASGDASWPLVGTDGSAASPGSSSTNDPPSFYGAMSSVKNAIQQPVTDMRNVATDTMNIKDFWDDMVRRERTEMHQGTLVLGWLQVILMLSYVIVCATDHNDGADRTFLSYVGLEIGIAAVAQLFYSTGGICVENSSMLLMALINGVCIAARLGLSIQMDMLPRAADISFFAIFTVLVGLHSFCAFRAWNGEFSRFIAFRVSMNGSMQRLYRRYELLMAVSLMDFQISTMAISTVLFFTSVMWWHYFLFGMLLFVGFVQRGALRHAVRNESKFELKLWLPFSLVLPLVVGFALFKYEFVKVVIDKQCESVAYLTALLFLIARVCLGFSVLWCALAFKRGMKGIFAKEKTFAEFFEKQRADFRPFFLTQGEIPEGHESIRSEASQSPA